MKLIVKSMALAFFASAYADQAEEKGEPLRGEIMDQLPDEIDSEAIKAANTLAKKLVEQCWPNPDKRPANSYLGLVLIFRKICSLVPDGDRPLDYENFGHYLAMQAMGHGVGLWDAFGQNSTEWLDVPYIEFSSFSLSKEYF